ncbi:hypothetical protein BY458DRAFT_570188 [Sporodiniella umbellata]|nr:hypothetical protein BY458DRAFT_570188 [Sporodiniella umbellata]
MSNDPNVFNVFESVMAGAGSSIEGIAKVSLQSKPRKPNKSQVWLLIESTKAISSWVKKIDGNCRKFSIKQPSYTDTFIKATGKGTIQVSFTLGNLSPLPIKSAQATLKLEHPSVDIRIAKEANVFDDTNLETHVAQSFFDTPIDLSPQTEYEQLIELHVSNAVQCDGVIEISLVNLADPSSLVFIKHAFGVYLIDQLVVGEVDESKKETLDVKRMEEYPIEFVREMMNIHPTQGINLGTRCQYSDNKVR